ncbi:hypothetical protein C6501_14925 [Candidatus Poribacteria bacterium]|nr:MAG: hypothetical protein C6501_14925 [Candidatus Poribacteria bacterium]
MKFKLIQFSILLIFSISVITLVPQYEVFSTPSNEHDPEFYIDVCGKEKDGATDDPRWKSFCEINGTNGDRYVSAHGWAFKPGILDGGDSSSHEPGDHLSGAAQLIYKVTIDGSASTGSTSASGSVTPDLSDLHKVPVPGRSVSHSGRGMINLGIPELDFHLPHYLDGQYYFCEPFTAGKHEYKMEEYASIYVDVRVYNIDKRKKSSLSLSPTSTYGNATFSYSESSTESHDTLRKESFGINATIGKVRWWQSCFGISLQGKSADVKGKLAGAEGTNFSINAAYPKAEDTWCPGEPSIGSKSKLPHGTRDMD